MAAGRRAAAKETFFPVAKPREGPAGRGGWRDWRYAICNVSRWDFAAHFSILFTNHTPP